MRKHNAECTQNATARFPRRIVTQEMLSELLAARRRADRASRRCAEMEKNLINLINAETPVERGALSARVQGWVSYELDMGSVRNYMDEMTFSLFKTSLPLTPRKELVIEDRDEGIEIESEDASLLESQVGHRCRR